MTLTTHAIVGAAVATAITGQPAIGFAIGFASHFILDALPHWDYKLRSAIKDEDDHMHDMSMDKNFLIDLLKIFCDFVLGFGIVFLTFGIFKMPISLWWRSAVLWGAIGGVFPDALQFFYFKCKHWPLTWTQRFHGWCDERSENIQESPVLGISIQLLIIVLAVGLARFF